MSKEGRLSRVGVLAPAALSACMDASVLAVPAASAIVSTVLKELSKAFMLKKWFHGNISAKEAEELMMERGKHGSFLVRESRGRPGDYVLTIRSKCRVSHVVIRKQDDKYDIGTGEEFDDLTGLIEHFRKFPIVETSGEMLRLLQPLGGLCVRGIESEGSDEETKRERAASMKIKREKWRKEFQILQFLDNIMYFTTSEAKKLENLLKNRYRDVRPYDQTRVVLSKRSEHDSDYINANYIKNAHMFYSTFNGYRSSNESIISAQSLLERSEKAESELRASKSLTENNTHDVKRSLPLEKYDNTPIAGNEVMYIATQGCLFETTNDFWRMIYQEDVRIIVMVARECERGKIKCARYWPDRKKKAYFDRFKVVCFSEKIHEEYLVRELEVYDEMNNCRTVYQYQYFAWPDHGAPMQVNGILGLIVDINACISSIMRYRNSPDKVILCVHCSAGIGRTGTFIALHMLIDKINNAGLDADLNVFETVKLIRSQRSGMVQSEDQYAFINCAVEEYVNTYVKKRGKKNKFLFLKD